MRTRLTHLCISLVPHLLVLATLDEHPTHSFEFLSLARVCGVAAVASLCDSRTAKLTKIFEHETTEHVRSV